MAKSKGKFRLGCALGVIPALFLGFIVFNIALRLLHPFVFLTMPDSVARGYVHTMIRSGMRGHDVVLSLGGVANEDSIPILISLLPESPVEPENDCVYGHPRETLNRLTNCAPGYDRASWETWWESNSAKSLEQIREDSFAEIGLQIPWEMDVDSARLLMRALVHEQEHWRNVAREQLNAFPDIVLERASSLCVGSPETADRIGVLAWMDDIATEQKVGNVIEPLNKREIAAQFAPDTWVKREEILRALTKDPVQEVRASALHKLNKQISLTLVGDEENVVVQEKQFGDGILSVSMSRNASSLFIRYEDGRPQILAGGEYDYGETRRLASYNLETGRTDWEYVCPEHILSTPLDTTDRLFVYQRNSVVALDLSTGKELWSTPVDSGSETIRGDKMLLHGDNLIVNTTHALLALSQANGQVLWRVDLKSENQGDRFLRNGSIGYAARHFFVATQEDTLLKVNDQGVVVNRCPITTPKSENAASARSSQYFEGVFGVIAQGDAVYTGAFINGRLFVQAHSAETLDTRWSVLLANTDHTGDIYLAGDTLLCTWPGQLCSIRRETGAFNWLESAPESSPGPDVQAINGGFFITEGVINGLTVRRLHDGEVVAVYAEYDYIFLDNGLAIGHSDGTLRFVEVDFAQSQNNT